METSFLESKQTVQEKKSNLKTKFLHSLSNKFEEEHGIISTQDISKEEDGEPTCDSKEDECGETDSAIKSKKRRNPFHLLQSELESEGHHSKVMKIKQAKQNVITCLNMAQETLTRDFNSLHSSMQTLIQLLEDSDE